METLMKTVNITIELDNDEQIHHFEIFLKKNVTVKDFTILSDTKKLYENDIHFKSLTKKYYAVKRLRNDYINKHNFK